MDRPLELAREHHRAGRLGEAQAAYQAALAADPQNAFILNMLGIVTCQMGGLEAGAYWLERAVGADPTAADYQCNLGSALAKLKQLDAAIASYRCALKLNPNYPEAYSNLSDALCEKEQFEEAVAMSRRALALRPDYAAAHNNLGRALRAIGFLDEAIGSFSRAAELQPHRLEIVTNLAAALNAKGRWDEAIASGRRALDIRPGDANASLQLANALQFKGKIDEATGILRGAIESHPGHAGLHNGLGNVLQAAGKVHEAIAAFGTAAALEPGNAPPHSNLVYALHFDPSCDTRTMLKKHLEWDERHARPLARAIRRHENDANPDRRLRIGYVSPDFNGHVVGRNILPLLRLRDKENFEVFCYSNGTRPDAITEQFQAYADGWRDIVGVSDERAAENIREDRIDILVDLALHMRDSRMLLFARKPAPVQVTFGGYPGGTGLKAMDHRLTDPNLDPPGKHDGFYCEKSVRLPESFWCYDFAAMELGESPAVNALPALTAGYVTFGSLNNFVKTNEETFGLWAECLAAVGGARLILMSPEGEHRRRVAEKLRVDPERVEFVGFGARAKYLQQYQRIDLGLDTFPYNGHTTSLDSIWMGVPVISLCGETAVSRAGFSQAKNLGLAEELIANSREDFVRLAAGLAGDLPRLARMRAELRGRMEKSPLMDGRLFARNVEGAYREIWREWCKGK